VDDLDTYIALLRKPKAAAGANDGGGGGAVIGRVLEFVGRRGAGAMPWQDAARPRADTRPHVNMNCD
jgi:hypothetical protein